MLPTPMNQGPCKYTNQAGGLSWENSQETPLPASKGLDTMDQPEEAEQVSRKADALN